MLLRPPFTEPAAFGVVLITTKKAKGNKLNVALNAMVGYRTIGKMPELVTDPYTVMDVKTEAGNPCITYTRSRCANMPKSVLLIPRCPQ